MYKSRELNDKKKSATTDRVNPKTNLISVWPRQKKFESYLLWLCALPRWVIGYWKIRTTLVVVQKQNQWTRFARTCFPSRCIASGTCIFTASLDWLVHLIVCVLGSHLAVILWRSINRQRFGKAPAFCNETRGSEGNRFYSINVLRSIILEEMR